MIDHTYSGRSDEGPAATETSSLWGGTDRPRGSTSGISVINILSVIATVLFAIVLAQNAGLWPTLADDIPASEKAVLRERWRLERQMWVVEKGQWDLLEDMILFHWSNVVIERQEAAEEVFSSRARE